VPAEGRFCRHSHGAAADKQTALDKATYKSKNPAKGNGGSKGKQHGRTPKGPDGCYNCGSKLHCIDQCTAGHSGHLGVAAPPSVGATNSLDQETLKTLRAFADKLDQRDKEMAAATDALQGQAAQIAPPNAYDEIRLMDDELANLFKGGMGR
jgi:hypothetical protein